MKSRNLVVEGALEFTPHVNSDQRGLFVSPFQGPAFTEAAGGPLFPVEQTNHSRSRRGVVRGIHFTAIPPGTAKYLYCARGAVLDIVVDVRVGSPTFGMWDTVQMDQVHFRTMYCPVGVGHAFVVLEDDTVMSYMLSASYVPDKEMALDVRDPALALPLLDDVEPILSERDHAAPTLAEAKAAGILPEYERCREIEDALRGRRTSAAG